MGVGVELRLLHLEDIDLDLLVVEFLQLFLQFVDILSALTDDDTRTSRADGDGDELERALDDDARHACISQALVEILADFLVFNQVVTEVLATEPVGVPTSDYTQTIAYRINFLSHSA